jgi:hypothetical protein
MLPESDRPDQEEQIPTDDANSWFWKPHTLTGTLPILALF